MTDNGVVLDAAQARALPFAVTPYAAGLYSALGPLTTSDPDNAWALLRYLMAVARMIDDIDALVRDTDTAPGWSVIMSPDTVPDYGLPWLGQFIGVVLPPGVTTDQARQMLRDPAGFRRGQPATIVAAAQATLTGSRTVLMTERYGGDPYLLRIVTFTDETPDPTATRKAILTQKPAGIVLDYVVMAGRSYAALASAQNTYRKVATAYPTYRQTQAH